MTNKLLTDDENQLAELARRANGLWQSPEPGLISWRSMVMETMTEMVLLWQKMRGKSENEEARQIALLQQQLIAKDLEIANLKDEADELRGHIQDMNERD